MMVVMARMVKIEQTETIVRTVLMAWKALDSFFRRGRVPRPPRAESYGRLALYVHNPRKLCQPHL